VGDSLTTPNPLGPGTLSVAVAPLGYQGEFGFLLAGSGRPGFPDDIQRALRGVGANQVALAVKERQLSERRRHELALRESDERFRTTFAHASVGMAMATPQGRFLQVNRAYCEMTGYTEEELLAT